MIFDGTPEQLAYVTTENISGFVIEVCNLDYEEEYARGLVRLSQAGVDINTKPITFTQDQAIAAVRAFCAWALAKLPKE